MSKHLERDLEKLHETVLTLAGHVEDAVGLAVQALQQHDLPLARAVAAGDDRIDRLENDVHNECLKILALHQPVAVDLRRISAVMMIVTDLERMGDGAVGIAERVESLARPPLLAVPALLGHMTDLTTHMVRASIDSFVHLDTAGAGRVIRMDDEVDRDNVELIAYAVQEMKRTPAMIEHGLSFFTAVRYLERIADHATNVAEDVIYLANGEIVRHKPEAIPAV